MYQKESYLKTLKTYTLQKAREKVTNYSLEYYFDRDNALSIHLDSNGQFVFELCSDGRVVAKVDEDTARMLVVDDENVVTNENWKDFIHASGRFCEDK